MTMSRTHTIQIVAHNSTKFPLGELRWLVAQLEGAPDTVEVKVKAHHATDQRDQDSVTISADAPDRPVRPSLTHRPGMRGGAPSSSPYEPGDGHP